MPPPLLLGPAGQRRWGEEYPPLPASQINAAGALCNLGLDFSSVKNVVLASGALGPLVRMAGIHTY